MLLLVVSTVGFLVHVYSIGYMDGDRGFWRFFAYLNLFMFSMLLLILGAVTLPIGVGLILLPALGIWMLADLFLIPGMVNQQRDLLRQSLRSEFAANA